MTARPALICPALICPATASSRCPAPIERQAMPRGAYILRLEPERRTVDVLA